MSKDSEIRRMSLLKSSGVSPISVLNLAVEILKARAEDVTVPAIYATAGELIMHLPELKNAVDAINLGAAKEAEKWVVGNDLPTPAPAPASTSTPLPEPVAVEVDFSAPDAPSPVTKTDDVNTVVGEVAAVSKSGKGIKIGDVWYNVTTKTKKAIEPERGKMVQIKYVQGNSGFLVDQIDPA